MNAQPRRYPAELSLRECHDIITRIQKALWWSQTAHGEHRWELPEDVEYDATEEIAAILITYHLEPQEQLT